MKEIPAKEAVEPGIGFEAITEGLTIEPDVPIKELAGTVLTL